MSEDTDWEQHYQDGFMPWDKGAVAPPLLDWLAQNPGQFAGRVLVPGCGLGHDVRAIAEQVPDAIVEGLDLSPKAVELAREMAPANQEQYFQEDLFALPDRFQSAYDWVWEHTCFCAIDPESRDNYVVSIDAVLKPGGKLLAVFYLDPYDEDHQPGGRPPHGTSVEEIMERFTVKGRFQVIEEYSPQVSYPGREGLEYMVLFQKP